jgi:hypothetical protein
MKILDKIKDKYEDLMYMIPDGMWFVIKCSVISIIWITLIA